MREVPNPGSDEALADGCLCPVIDNGHGRGLDVGRPERQFIFDGHCRLHPPGWGTKPVKPALSVVKPEPEGDDHA